MIEFFIEIENVEQERVEVVEKAIEKIIEDYKFTLNSLNVILLSDDELLEINEEFLEHDFYTDIITFNYSELPATIEGELYISADRVRENALLAGTDFYSELYRVVIHGVLHLVGFQDDTKEAK